VHNRRSALSPSGLKRQESTRRILEEIYVASWILREQLRRLQSSWTRWSFRENAESISKWKTLCFLSTSSSLVRVISDMKKRTYNSKTYLKILVSDYEGAKRTLWDFLIKNWLFELMMLVLFKIHDLFFYLFKIYPFWLKLSLFLWFMRSKSPRFMPRFQYQFRKNIFGNCLGLNITPLEWINIWNIQKI